MEINQEKVAKIKDVLASLRVDWCVACGAGARVARDFIETVQEQTMASLISRETVEAILPALKAAGARFEDNWCVACGAAARRLQSGEQSVEREESLEAATKAITSILKGT
jgi:hypothetical protein